MKKLIVFTLIIIFSAGILKSVCSQENFNKQIEKIVSACDKPDIPGGFAVTVIKDNTIVFKKAYGYADYENKIPFSTSTVFDYASVAKQFTGFAIAQLIRDGKLHLDDDIRIY